MKHCLDVLKKYQSNLYTEILQIQGQNSCTVWGEFSAYYIRPFNLLLHCLSTRGLCCLQIRKCMLFFCILQRETFYCFNRPASGSVILPVFAAGCRCWLALTQHVESSYSQTLDRIKSSSGSSTSTDTSCSIRVEQKTC